MEGAQVHDPPVAAAAGGPGVEFTETMRGFVSTRATEDFQTGFEQGRQDASALEFTVTITAPDLERLVRDRAHEASLSGTVTASALSEHPLQVQDGRFNLLIRDADTSGARTMVYTMPLLGEDGTRLLLHGVKEVHNDDGADLWKDTTTLFVTVHEGADVSGAVKARGILTIHAADFAKQLGTMRAVGAHGTLEALETLARFGRLFAGSLNEVYGGVFARPSTLNPDAAPRRHRALRCGAPEVHDFLTDDGVGLRLTRFKGGTKGPVILSPGFGTSAYAYTIDTTETNFPEYLYEHGYDVWVFDYRASPDLPSASTQFSLDDIARHDYPAAVKEVLTGSGAESVQIVAHCIGSLTMLMSLAGGLEGVRSVVASQVTLHPRTGRVNNIRAGLHAPDVLNALGLDTLATDPGKDPSWTERLYDTALHLYPSGDEECGSPFCRRVMFIYGEVYNHDQLNDATHEALHEAFGPANLTTFKQITRALRVGHIVSAEGEDVYLPATDRLRLPIAFIHGECNRLFLPEGSKLTFDYLCEHNGPELYTRTVIPGYAHMDCFIGKDAARDVYPLITAELDKHN